MPVKKRLGVRDDMEDLSMGNNDVQAIESSGIVNKRFEGSSTSYEPKSKRAHEQNKSVVSVYLTSVLHLVQLCIAYILLRAVWLSYDSDECPII